MKKSRDIKTTLTMKKMLCSMLSAAMVVTSMPMGAFAAEAETSEPAIVVEDADAEVIAQADETEVTEKAASDEIVALAEGEEGEETPSETPTEPPTETPATDSVETIEINQGFSFHTGLDGAKETYMNDFVAKKQTVVVVKIPGSDADGYTEDQAKTAASGFKLEAKAVTNGQEADNCELTAAGDNFSVKQVFDKDGDLVKGWYATVNFPTGPDKGTYNFHIKDANGKEIGTNNGVNFYETNPLNILVVPVKGYWGAHYEGAAPAQGAYSCKDAKYKDPLGNEKDWSSLCAELKTYLLDVYPISEVNFEEGNEIDASDPSYDMCTDDGQRKLWEEACKLQSKNKEGKDRYDLILAFVQYRQDQGSGQGYTFGKPTNIITYSDVDMLPTVAHEIAHCYQVGDEYNGGSFNAKVNYPPNGYSGRDFVSGANISSSSGAPDYWKSPKQFKQSYTGDKKSKINENGAGTMVPLSLHPYSLSQEKFITWGGMNADGTVSGDSVGPTISWMGSGYSGCDGYYWTTSVIWDHLFKQFVSKEKKPASSEQPAEESGNTEQTEESTESESSNADVYFNALMSGEDDENSIFGDDDFYFDDDCRWGDSQMVEVEGWLIKDKKSSTGVKADVDPMFSYNGDLEYIEPLEDIYENSKDIYTFAALDKDGKVIASPVDGEWAVAEFYGGFFNPRGKAGDTDEVHFRFDAEYPEGTADFVIIKGRVKEDGTYDGAVVWQATADDSFTGEFDKSPEGKLVFADVNADTAEVEWAVYYPKENETPYAGPTDDAYLYTEVYYCPQGDDGEAYYLGCSEDEDWEEGYINFDMSEFKSEWTKNAYVWIKVTNGINAIDIYSDENDITLYNSTVTLSGAGIKTDKTNNGYYAECTGSAITPKVSVKAFNPETGKYINLTAGTDYTVTYADNVKAGWATVTVQGTGSYGGKNVVEFEIVPKALNATPGSIPNMVYSTDLDKNIVKYLVMTDKSGNQLVYDTDFTVDYTANNETKTTLAKLITKAPESKVSVTVTYIGKGNYEGENTLKKGTVTFDVVPPSEEVADISAAVITLKSTSAQYSGKAVKPAIKKVELGDKKLKKSDYSVVYTNNTEMGTGRVTIVGKKNYTGSASTTFTIDPKKVKSISVSGIKSQPYTGSAVSVDSLPIVVKAGGITLTKGVDYTVETSSDSDYVSVTTKANKAKSPKIIIKLISTSDAKKLNKKPSEYPKVEWADNVKDNKKTVTKTFSIVQTNLNNAAVTFGAKSKDTTANVVSDSTGKQIGILRNATKEEIAKDNHAYALVITGEADALVKNADLTKALSLKVFGKELKTDEYTITVAKTKDGNTGKITIASKKNGNIKGKRVIKFKYVKGDIKPKEVEPEPVVDPDKPEEPEAVTE